MSPLVEMSGLVATLKQSGYRVGLVSNTIPNTAEDIRAHGGYDQFDFTILSYEVGYAKPDLEIYQLAMAQLPGIKPSEVVFIDDQEKCLVAARELGMSTILADNPAQVIADVSQLL